jgi:hypothetical protein
MHESCARHMHVHHLALKPLSVTLTTKARKVVLPGLASQLGDTFDASV